MLTYFNIYNEKKKSHKLLMPNKGKTSCSIIPELDLIVDSLSNQLKENK